MKKVKYIFSVLLLLSCANILLSQEFDAKKVLKDYIDKITVSIPDQGKVYYMNFTMTVKNRSNGSVDKTEVTYLLSSDKMVYKTNHFSYFLDAEDAFMIFPGQQSIVWNKGGGLKDSNLQQNKIIQGQLSLIENATIHSVRELPEKKDTYEIVIGLSDKERKLYKIDGATYYFNKAENKLDKVIFIRVENRQEVMRVIEYNDVNLDYKGEKLSSAKSYVLSKDGMLQKKYSNYNLIRNKETN